MDKNSAEIKKAEFSKSLRGYTVSEVDRYVKNLTEGYAALYRENAELHNKLADAEEKISELKKIKDTLEDAKKRSSDIVHDAYEDADGILYSIKNSCDSIIRGFRKKIEEQQRLLAEAREKVNMFRYELFEKYRVHIELIEQLKSEPSDEEILSANDYVERVVSTLKHEVAAEYDISIDDIEIPDNEQTATQKNGERRIDYAAAQPSGEEKYVKVDDENSDAYTKRRMPDVVKKLGEYEKKQAQALDDDCIQLALDIDAVSSDQS